MGIYQHWKSGICAGAFCVVVPLAAQGFVLNLTGSTVIGPGSIDPWGLAAQSFTVTLVLNDAATDSNASAFRGDYLNAVTSLSIVIGGATIAATGGNMGVENDYFDGAGYSDVYFSGLTTAPAGLQSFTGLSDNNATFNVNLVRLLLLRSSSTIPIAMLTSDSLFQVPTLPTTGGSKLLNIEYTGGQCSTQKCGVTANVATVARQTVPEPGSLLLLGAGIAGLGLARRRKV